MPCLESPQADGQTIRIEADRNVELITGRHHLPARGHLIGGKNDLPCFSIETEVSGRRIRSSNRHTQQTSRRLEDRALIGIGA